MYAIRSYYGGELISYFHIILGQWRVLHLNGRFDGIPGFKVRGYFGNHRITSYNVCYTKLLRDFQVAHAVDALGVDRGGFLRFDTLRADAGRDQQRGEKHHDTRTA